MIKILQKAKLDELISHLIKNNYEFFAPKEHNGQSQYDKITRANEIAFDMILPKNTLKSLFFPRSECILKYKIAKRNITISQTSPESAKRVIFGVRPCDARAISIDDSLFNWDYQDEYWLTRKNNSIIISIACTESDEFCMCTSLGNNPDDTQGSDILLYPLADETGWQVKEITEKGENLIKNIEHLITKHDAQPDIAQLANPEQKFNIEKVIAWLEETQNFDKQFWEQISQRCIGCGICTYMCPTCHCFDIQDEGDFYTGNRRKNWDSCSFALFTLHTSGHNPRPTQASRWRQRIMHKFNYYIHKFNTISCTGCGRCTRLCPVDMGITETLTFISDNNP